jgi:Flp pilus assembly protein TadB
MIVILVIGLVFVGVAAGLLARALLVSRRYAAETVSHISAYGFEAEQPAGARRGSDSEHTRVSLRERLDSMATALGGLISGRVQSVSEESLRQRLMAAGYYTMPPRRFVGYQVLATIGAATFSIWWAIARDIQPLIGLCVVVVALLAGWGLPLVYVKRRGRLRGERIDYEMPELIDTLVTTVEAGLSFSA